MTIQSISQSPASQTRSVSVSIQHSEEVPLTTSPHSDSQVGPELNRPSICSSLLTFLKSPKTILLLVVGTAVTTGLSATIASQQAQITNQQGAINDLRKSVLNNSAHNSFIDSEVIRILQEECVTQLSGCVNSPQFTPPGYCNNTFQDVLQSKPIVKRPSLSECHTSPEMVKHWNGTQIIEWEECIKELHKKKAESSYIINNWVTNACKQKIADNKQIHG